MELYFSPLACSMASRIALYEAGAEAAFVEVDARAKRLADGGDFLSVNPLGLVPVLREDSGELLTENAAILQHLSERFPEAGLAPAEAAGRQRLRQWLSFVATELHKGLFMPLLSAKSNEGARAYALEVGRGRLDFLSRHLEGRDYLLEAFSVADAYLVTVLGWSRATSLNLADWPVLKAYVARLRERPSVARALAEELALYEAQEQRRAS
ncbi:glutathione S-transferase [Tistlia consotensis]|uniref:Glutathione S-transferase n=1 Tax=Tistlia consotensis USBA 355 TaxID=560819 RepID=A0A1Y6CMG6_9PROT|nr:glutathione binding-like protein [Tistlia consotensis]SMF77685.1 glutathione S-transferase [Tistlia consotensis USBA 355]SNS20838.1 glutathione S-transferase [Tistlia consotensis]